jgi:signal transduction histidine kinase
MGTVEEPSKTDLPACGDRDDLEPVEEELRRRAREIQAYRQALQEADRRENEFLAMLAHELRNPLAPVRNAVQILRRLDASEPELRWVREVIDRQVTHLSRLVDDLLDISRVTRNEVRLHPHPVELAGIIAHAVETVQPLVQARRHRLTTALPAEPVRVVADPDRLIQIIENLLTNAAQYTPDGGRIEIAAEHRGGDVLIRVRDNGIGIAPDLLPRVFDLFAQANRGLDRRQGGLGVGLTLVRRLVEMHGGSVSAHSAGSGAGSVFTVRLPA